VYATNYDEFAPLTPAGAAIQLQGSNDGTTWSVLYSTTVRGTKGETITSLSSNITAGNFQQHRLAIAGNGTSPVYVAQLALNIDNTGNNEQ
jgi:hypothetical protein